MKSFSGDRPGPPNPRDFFALFIAELSTFFVLCTVASPRVGVAGVAKVNEVSVGAGVFRLSSPMCSATRFVNGVPTAVFALAPFSRISAAVSYTHLTLPTKA